MKVTPPKLLATSQDRRYSACWPVAVVVVAYELDVDA